MWCTVPAPWRPAPGGCVVAPLECALLAGEPVGAAADRSNPSVPVSSGAAPGARDRRRGRPGADEGVLGRDLGVHGGQRRVAGLGDDQLEAQAVVVAEGQPRRPALVAYPRGEPAGPEVERRRGRHAELECVDHALARSSARRAGELEPGEDRARAPVSSPK